MKQSVNRKMSNGVRSGIVVVGALAFGYLTLNIGFKPFLEKAAQQQALDLDSPTDPSPTEYEAMHIGRNVNAKNEISASFGSNLVAEIFRLCG